MERTSGGGGGCRSHQTLLWIFASPPPLMKEDTPLVGAVAATANPADSPIGQNLMKLIGNVCFSAFVLSVLIFTVVAITYHPPDPWLDSAKAITKSLSDTLPNATFTTDDSLLPTGEDLVDAPPQLLPPVPSAIVPGESPPCDADADAAAINCSDPRVLSAIRSFTGKFFSRRAIVFVSYELPVDGPHPGECDAAWRYRNRREKSWRKYRDFRRFRLTAGDNCTYYKVASMGKFRSGLNIGKPRPRSAPRSSSSSASSSWISNDMEINDTIPIIGSEKEFRGGRYLYYSRGGDHCKGMNHYLWSFLCGLGEAQYLNRTFVVDLGVCLASEYNPSGKEEDGKDFRFYFDFEHLKESASVVEKQEFFSDWQRWEKKGKISVRKVPTYKVSSTQLKKDRNTIIWRQFEGVEEPENYWYRVCEGRSAKYLHRPWQAIWKSKRLTNIVSEIAGKMDWDYDAAHVVRGWKAQNKEMFPNLDGDTSPEALVEKLGREIRPWRNLYVATNEPFYGYFDKLRSHYHVHLLDDYKEMWGNTSEWYNETAALNGGRPVEFDGFMRVAVDTEVLFRAKTRVETFYNLTRDCKDGVNTC